MIAGLSSAMIAEFVKLTLIVVMGIFTVWFCVYYLSQETRQRRKEREKIMKEWKSTERDTEDNAEVRRGVLEYYIGGNWILSKEGYSLEYSMVKEGLLKMKYDPKHNSTMFRTTRKGKRLIKEAIQS